jgi:alkanesulfonate monooxygenase SsuD/methylene tetrahydromethanopterin reductase-like flavin-dependent oxidoreductase (luciferase family)
MGIHGSRCLASFARPRPACRGVGLSPVLGGRASQYAGYRSQFIPSVHLARPYAMVGVNVLAAATDAHARFLFTSQQQAFINLGRGTPSQVPPPGR